MSSITGGDGKGTVDKDMDVEDRDTEEHMLKMMEVEGTHTEEGAYVKEAGCGW
jgi:hypothetical protein